MHIFHIRYRNSQGVLMRILNAISRRGLDLSSVHAEPAAEDYLVTLLVEVMPKQIGQLSREWYSIVDVVDVRSGTVLHGHSEAQWAPMPPASAGMPGQSALSARA